MMNCKDAGPKLHALLDQTLERQEAARVRKHVEGCAACAEEFRLLEFLAASIAALPERSPSAAFSENVLGALGAAGASLPRWAKWTAGAMSVLTSAWTAGLVLLLSSRLSLPKALRAAELAAHPSQALLLFKFQLAKSLLVFGDFITTLHALGRLLGPRMAEQSPRLLAAAALAGLFVATISRKTPLGVSAK